MGFSQNWPRLTLLGKCSRCAIGNAGGEPLAKYYFAKLTETFQPTLLALQMLGLSEKQTRPGKILLL